MSDNDDIDPGIAALLEQSEASMTTVPIMLQTATTPQWALR